MPFNKKTKEEEITIQIHENATMVIMEEEITDKMTNGNVWR